MLTIALLDLGAADAPECLFAQGLLPQQQSRLQEFGSEKRQREYLYSRLLINHIVAQRFPQLSLIDCYRDSDTGPVLDGLAAPVFLSLSHSHQAIALAISSAPIGIDLERIKSRRNFQALAHMFMSAQELAEFMCLEGEQQRYEFYRLWSLKEALYKGLGKRQAEFRLADLNASLAKVVHTETCLDDQYMLAVASF